MEVEWSGRGGREVRRDWRGIGLKPGSRPRGRNVIFFMCLFEETSNKWRVCFTATVVSMM